MLRVLKTLKFLRSLKMAVRKRNRQTILYSLIMSFYVLVVTYIFNKIVMTVDDEFCWCFNICTLQNKEAGDAEFWEPTKYLAQ